MLRYPSWSATCYHWSLPPIHVRSSLEDHKDQLPRLVSTVKSSKGCLDELKNKEDVKRALSEELHSDVAKLDGLLT